MPGQKVPEAIRRRQILDAALQVALRDGIAGVTVRAVAAEAGLSHGLVLFHFKRKDPLVQALLASVLTEMLTGDVAPADPGVPRALDRLRLRLQQEMARLAREPGRVRLLLECWALGARHPALREQVSEAFERYRAGFRPVIEEVLREEAPALPGVSATGLAALAVGLISQCVVQELIDPDRFPVAEYLSTAETLLGALAAR